jgi:2-C-methyl-D-erythritol 4-phosphate cytidylyltransferase
MMSVSAIFLAGGSGTRMNAAVPKQYLSLKGQPLAIYSLNVLLAVPEIQEVIVVCDPSYQSFFKHEKIRFALPGIRRQDSVYNGFKKISITNQYVCVHDSARPIIDKEMMKRVLCAAEEYGAAAVGMPIKFTVKETHLENFVKSTPDRSQMWEVQTPQVIRKDLLQKGFEIAHHQGITVTDDVSLVELFDHPVKLVQGSFVNLKVTTAEDMRIAESLLENL